MSVRKVPRLLDGKYFEIVKCEEDGSVKASCVACGPTSKEFSGSINVTSNFLKHLKRKHSSLAAEYESNVDNPGKRQKQSVLPFPVTIKSRAQTKAHRSVLRFVVGIGSPVSLADNDHFIQLVSELNPEASVQCSKTLRGQILDEYESMKKALVRKLAEVEYIAVTCDIWSSTGRSFLGVTGHWIKSDLSRESIVLALRRFTGTHSYDRIVRLINGIFKEFNIEAKTISVTTDNGSNFIKAFQNYGLETIYDDKDDTMETGGTGEDDELDDVDLVILKESDLEFLVPEHFRCGSHTLSLVATKDLEDNLPSTSMVAAAAKGRKHKGGEKVPSNPLASSEFKSLLRSTFAKCTAFWNTMGRSTQASERVKNIIGASVVRPVITRWNSTFDSVKFLLRFKSQLGDMFEAADVRQLDPVQIQFLKEYHDAMEPVAAALDTLQTEKGFYFGFYAPTIVNLQKQLENLISTETRITSVIAWTLNESLKLNNRFGKILRFELESIKTEVISACTIPCIKMRWVPAEHKENVKRLFIECLEEFIDAPGDRSTEQNEQLTSKWDRMFGGENLETSDSCSAEVAALQFLNSEKKELSLLEAHPSVQKMFIKYNTPIPSSAPSERLFSYGGLILRPRRARLSDDIFESFTMLKLNKSHYEI